MIDTKKLVAGAKRHAPTIALAALALGAVILPEIAQAGSAQGMPWEAPLDKLKNSLTGPVALGVSVISIVVTGAGLVWGGEMNDFVRKAIMALFAISITVGATSFINVFFGANGATIAPAIEHVHTMVAATPWMRGAAL